MKKTALIAAGAVLVLAFSMTLVWAQGRGAGYGRIGQPCPYGYTQPNPNAGGWWTRVQPATPEQKAFVDEASRLHNRIREKQLEMARLRAAGGSEAKIAATQKDVDKLREKLYNVMIKNRELRQQMGPARQGTGFGSRWSRQIGPGAWQRGGSYGFCGRSPGACGQFPCPRACPMSPGPYCPWK